MAEFRGTSFQVPPQYSAKRVQGSRAYDIARQRATALLQPVEVTVKALDWLSRSGPELRVRVTATAGFYVRALARDLGRRAGCGGHVSALRRTSVGVFSVTDAIPLDACERLGPSVADRLISPADALPQLPVVRLTEGGLRRALHGNTLDSGHLAAPLEPDPAERQAQLVRILAPDGRLVALGKRGIDALHPVVVLG
jgi:tRNA pseudouridine55 synthase